MAKKCSHEGRALMQLDFRHFVMKLERIAEIKPLPYQDHVINYIKAYYIPEAELEPWVKIHTVIKLGYCQTFLLIEFLRKVGFLYILDKFSFA